MPAEKSGQTINDLAMGTSIFRKAGERCVEATKNWRAWKGWFLPGVALAVGVIYTFLPSIVVFLGPAPDLGSLEAPRDRGAWISLNKSALKSALKGEAEGEAALARLLKWNRTKRYGVDLRGVELRGVFREIKAPMGGGTLLEYLHQGGSERIGKLVSLRHSDITGSKHPGVPLRGLDMSDVRADRETIENWARAIDGRGLMGVNLSGVPLHDADFEGCHLGGADLSYTGIAIKADPAVPGKFNSTRLLGLDLVGRDLAGLTLKNCDLRMTAIRPDQLVEVGRAGGGGGLRGAIFPSVDLVFEDMSGVGLQRADLRLTGIGQRQLSQVEKSWGGTGLYATKLKEQE